MNDTIFQPQYIISPKIRTQIDEVERNHWLIRKRFLPPKHEAWFRRDVSIQRAAGTTNIEGATLNEQQVSDLIKKNPPAEKLSEDEQANLNALAAYRFVDYVSDQPEIPLSELVIRELNRYFLSGMSKILTPGVYRKGQVEVFKYTPPDQGDVPDLMRQFATWLQDDDETLPILKAGLAHIHLVAIHPFWDGNGRTARALATTILQRVYPGFQKLLSLESFIFSIREFYFAALEKTLGSRFSPDYDQTPWLEFFTTTLAVHTAELTRTLTDWHRSVDEVYEAFKPIGHRQVDGILFAAKTGRITRADYMEITGVSPVTASRDLAHLVEMNWLKPMGKTRSRVYFYARQALGRESGAPREQGRLFEEGGNVGANE